VLGELETLALIVRPHPFTINLRGRIGQALEDEPPDGLAMLQDEGHLAGADLEHRPGAGRLACLEAEAGVEEARIVDPELADQRMLRPAADPPLSVAFQNRSRARLLGTKPLATV
jgi:hypothetical protein